MKRRVEKQSSRSGGLFILIHDISNYMIYFEAKNNIRSLSSEKNEIIFLFIRKFLQRNIILRSHLDKKIVS